MQLKKWDIRKHLKAEEAVLLIGKRKSGKTTAAVAIAHELSRRKVEMAVAFSGTMDSQITFDSLLPPSFCFKGWDPEKALQQMQTMGKINGQRKREGKPPLECTMYLDDLGYNKKFKHCQTFAEIIMNGRHSGIRPVVAMQYTLSMSPEIRGNFDWIFLFRDILPSTRRRIKEHYAELLGDQFDAVFDACTENYGCLVIHNSGSSTKLEDIFYWYRAPIVHPDKNPDMKWRIGGDAMWKWNKKHYDPKRASQNSAINKKPNLLK